MANEPAAGGRGKGGRKTDERSTSDERVSERVDEVWAPDPLTVWSQRQEDSDGNEPIAVVLQHPLSPFRVTVSDADPATLNKAALGYLFLATRLAITPPFRLDPNWLEGLAGEIDAPPVGWVPFAGAAVTGQAIVQSSFASRLITRHKRTDGLALLVVAEVADGQFLGSGIGLKIVLHLRKMESGPTEVTIIGLTGLLPPRRVSAARSARAFHIEVRSLVKELQSLAEPLIGPNHLLIRGIRQALPDGAFDIHGIVLDPSLKPSAIPVPHVSDAVVLRVNRRDGTGSVIHRSPMIADATGSARVFLRDPSIRPMPLGARPTRAEATLDNGRADETVDDPLEGAIGGVKFKVLPCPRFVRADRTLIAAKARPAMPGSVLPTTPGGHLPLVRSDNASAVQGYHHVRDLLRRFEAYGIDAGQYFTCARPEILIAYRSGISPGPDKDGQGVNARVLPEGWAPDQVGSPKVKAPPRLFLLLALGDRKVRARKPRVPGGAPAPAEPLGIGADANWMWHEFGHVLLMATTGELELRFAHSPGDALAAIVADPAIVVAATAKPAPRYATFPWVCTARRHDRRADHGWGWSGPIHAPLAAVPDSLQPRRKSYLSEQILSSSLFRLYRCLGGDTDLQTAGALERQRASHYTLYLVMNALQLFGDATASPVTTPNGLVCRLVEADYFFWRWKATYLGTSFERVGGTAGKVICWAFEAQGLSWPPAASKPYGPGTPPQVDVYIASRRPTVDAAAGDPVDYGPGSYVPVPLEWQTPTSPNVPAWQADPAAVVVANDGTITVTVGNRGLLAAAVVTVDVWWAAWPAGDAAPPAWNSNGWKPVGPSLGTQNLAPGVRVGVGPFAATGATGRYVILARATCTADPALIDNAAAVLPTPIIDLVAGDNNLALLVVG